MKIADSRNGSSTFSSIITLICYDFANPFKGFNTVPSVIKVLDSTV